MYEVVFAALAHGFRYITLFSHYPQESLPFKIIERFKAKEIDDRVDDLYSEFEDERPIVINFYRYLFAAYQARYDYVTAFEDLVDWQYTDAFFVVDSFKRKGINTHIVEKVKIIFKCFKILLGDMINKRFTTSELIDKYGYPEVEYEKLVEFNKKWCRFHDIDF